MLAHSENKACALFHRMADTYVDGELLSHENAELLTHLHNCGRCREHIAWLRAMHQSLKKTALANMPKAPPHLRQKAELSIQENRGAPRNSFKQFDRMIGKPVLALAAAAGFIAALAADTTRWRPHPAEVAQPNTLSGTSLENTAQSIAASMNLQSNLDALFDDLVELHRKPPPPETMDLNLLTRFDTEVGIPIRKPVLPSLDASFEGARLYASNRARALQFQYRVAPRHRISLYMLDPQILRSAISAGVITGQGDETPVYIGHRRGFSIAAGEKNGVGIAVASDMNDDENKRVVLTALH